MRILLITLVFLGVVLTAAMISSKMSVTPRSESLLTPRAERLTRENFQKTGRNTGGLPYDQDIVEYFNKNGVTTASSARQ